MQIKNVHALHYKSLRQTCVTDCGEMNVLIGRNNAGKSNVLSAIRLMVEHLKEGVVAKKWEHRRPIDTICDRNESAVAQIGVEFRLGREENQGIRDLLGADSPQLGNAIAELESLGSLSVILGLDPGGDGVIFLESIAVGELLVEDGRLQATGPRVFFISPEAAAQLAARSADLSVLNDTIHFLEEFKESDSLELVAEHGAAMVRHRFRGAGRSRRRPGKGEAILERLAPQSSDKQDLADRIVSELDGLREERQDLSAEEIGSDFHTFSGVARSIPSYLGEIMSIVGGITILSLGERREPIGRAEAHQLLNLKVKRGGEEKLRRVQDTVESLLGVRIDAFRSDEERGPDRAELDVDEFLVDANGAGVREALRLIIDLELKSPDLVLLEEPEVHLHPGLEGALEGYLRKKSEGRQIFVTTHSTNFVDAVDFQNIYMVRRNPDRHTECITVGGAGDAWQIPAEIGLRLSTLFMFERLAFVEGPSDEAIIREFASKLGADLSRVGVGFVHMGGVRNYVHYAARATLDLLSKRGIPMWFVIDRDEKDDREVTTMMERLGGTAKLVPLERREIENFLLDPDALRSHLAATGSIDKNELPDADTLRADITRVALSLEDTVVRLRIANEVLGPVFPNRGAGDGGAAAKLEAARDEISSRLDSLEEVEARIKSETAQEWDSKCVQRARGSEILSGVLSGYKAAFSKKRGDGLRIARHIAPSKIPASIKRLIDDLSSPG